MRVVENQSPSFIDNIFTNIISDEITGGIVQHIGLALLGKGDHSLFLMDLVLLMHT